jgi:hypothetical protein
MKIAARFPAWQKIFFFSEVSILAAEPGDPFLQK